MEVLHLPSLSLSDKISEVTEENDIKSLLVEQEQEPPSASSTWSADAVDLSILFCSFLFVTASITFVALVFHTSAFLVHVPRETLSLLQRILSAFSIAVTSAVVMVAGRRYVLFKLARGGLRSRRLAVYSNPSIGNLAGYLMLRGAEIPLLALLGAWGLAAVTSLTVNDSWEMAPSMNGFMGVSIPSGPFNPATSDSTWTVTASDQLTFVMSSLCLGAAGTFGLIKVTSANTDPPMGTIYYPPLPYSSPNIGFSFSATMNGFNISMEQLPSIPSSARNLSCASSLLTTFELWSDASDNHTLSLIVVNSTDHTIFRFNATSIIMGGTLSSTGNYTEFALNGTSWPNVMSTGSQWAQDITGLVCNTTSPQMGVCMGSSFSDFAAQLNNGFQGEFGVAPFSIWSTVLDMALGAYSSAMLPVIGYSVPDILITQYDSQFTPKYGTYILIFNIVVSVAMMIVVVMLRLRSHLGADFINSTRLLLDPLKKPELFNASLETTVKTLSNPHVLVRGDSVVLLTEQEGSQMDGRKRVGKFGFEG